MSNVLRALAVGVGVRPCLGLFLLSLLLSVPSSLHAAAGPVGDLHLISKPCRLHDSRFTGGNSPINPGTLQLLFVREGYIFFPPAPAIESAMKVLGEPLPEKLPTRLKAAPVQLHTDELGPTPDCFVPDIANAVVVVVTVINATNQGHLRALWEGWYNLVNVSLVNYGPVVTAANTSTWATIPLCGDNWGFCDYDFGIYNAGPGTVDFAVYLYGWYEEPAVP